MSTTCPVCGAILPNGTTCREFFDLSQLKEIEGPEYYAVHHLSVLCYMLQHNIYSRGGWLGAHDLLDQFIYRGLTTAAARRQNRKKLDNGKRDWSLTKGEKLPGVEAVKWTFTIADVRLDTAEHYCADAHKWAETILADTEQLVNSGHDA
jgi:hypothetical protein